MVYYILAFIVFLVDQGTKYLIATRMELREEIPVIGNFFVITSHRNSGAAFGILQDHKLLPVALSLVLGGAIGNFLDRALTGEVVDFVQLNFGSYTFPIFNIADSAICVGVALIIVETLLEGRREKAAAKTEGNEQTE